MPLGAALGQQFRDFQQTRSSATPTFGAHRVLTKYEETPEVDEIEPSVAEADTVDRTNAIGLYHYGLSYRFAADALGALKLPTPYPDGPRELLYFQAIELFLKAYLRNVGLTALSLKAMGQNTRELEQTFTKHGGFLQDEDRAVLAVMDRGDAIARSRYSVTGPITKPILGALSLTAKNMAETVRTALKNAGHPIV
jgi:hypothetical protein